MGRLTKREGNSVRIGGLVLEHDEAWHKLAHYEDLEEQGRLIEQKHGRWIYKHDEEGNTGNAQYECSECGAGDLQAKSQEVPYCWKCGAKMSSEPSDEEKQAMTEEAFDILAKMDEVGE